jgi:hypothetical protein
MLLLVVMLYSVPVFAESSMDPVFSQIDDIVTRVESGISLNSYAESLAQIKIDYKKAGTSNDTSSNYLLSDRMKKVLAYMDEYARLWRVQDIDGKKFLAYKPTYLTGDTCAYYTKTFGTMYDIPCVKTVILEALKDTIGTAKTAHYDGW